MARILVVIDGDAHVRNTLRTPALEPLRAAHDCSFIAAASTTDRQLLESLPGFLGYYDSDPATAARHSMLFDALMWRHRRRSRTFLYRWLRSAGYGSIIRGRGPWLRFKSSVRWVQALTRRTHVLRAVVLGTEPIHTIVRRALERRIPINPELARFVDEGGFDLIVHPSNAYEATGSDLVRTTRGTPTRVLALIDNWDNLSSKTVLWAQPDHLAVWGEQSRQHAVDIQGVPADRVSAIGTPRFDAYFTARIARPPSPYPSPYVLFVGAALAVDELSALRVLDEEIAGDPDTYGDLRVVYRPHPWQQPRAVPAAFEADAFRRTVLDVQLAEAMAAGWLGTERNELQPDLDWYPPLLTNALAVIGPLTTMLLEGSLCHRPVIALAHDDGVHFTTPSQTLRWYRHFEGVEDIEGLVICPDLAELPDVLRRTLAAPQPDLARLDASLEHFLHHDERPYGARLLGTVDHVLAHQRATSPHGAQSR